MPCNHLIIEFIWLSHVLSNFFFKGSEGLIFVIDSSDASRIEEARDELFSIINDESMYKGVPTVVSNSNSLFFT